MLDFNALDLTKGQEHQVAMSIFGTDDLGRFNYIHTLTGDEGWCPLNPGVDNHDLAAFFAKGGVLVDETVEAPPQAPCTGPCRDCPRGTSSLLPA